MLSVLVPNTFINTKRKHLLKCPFLSIYIRCFSCILAFSYLSMWNTLKNTYFLVMLFCFSIWGAVDAFKRFGTLETQKHWWYTFIVMPFHFPICYFFFNYFGVFIRNKLKMLFFFGNVTLILHKLCFVCVLVISYVSN